jgi:hypothetical protein
MRKQGAFCVRRKLPHAAAPTRLLWSLHCKHDFHGHPRRLALDPADAETGCLDGAADDLRLAPAGTEEFCSAVAVKSTERS